MQGKGTNRIKTAGIVLTVALAFSGCGIFELLPGEAKASEGKYTFLNKKDEDYFVCQEKETKIIRIGSIDWHDEALCKVIASLLNTEAAELTYEQLSQVEELDFSKTSGEEADTIYSWEDLRYFTNLKALTIDGHYLDIFAADYEVIGELTSLQYLLLNNVVLPDASFVRNLTDLRELYIMECGLTDISFVEPLDKLWNVSFYDNYLTDISPLAGHNQLEVLSLAKNSMLEDVSALGSLPALKEAGLHYCAIRDVSALADAKNLKKLNLSGNTELKTEGLGQLVQLDVLALNDCNLQDISPLENLTDMKQLHLSRNELTDISPLSGMTQLCQIHLTQNQISDFTPLENMSNLYRVDIYGNPIEKLPESLMGTPYLYCAHYFSWKTEKEEEEANAEEELALELLETYCPEQTGNPLDMIKGYLNEDEYEDLVILVGKYDDYVFQFYVFLGSKDGTYRYADVIEPEDAEFLYWYYYGIAIENHNLILSCYYLEQSGWGLFNNCYYQYIDGSMVKTYTTDMNFYALYPNSEVVVYDYLQKQSAYYALVEQENAMQKLLLESGDIDTEYHKDDNLYPVLSPYYDYQWIENPAEWQEEAFEAVLQQEFEEYEKKTLEYTPETRENYSKLSGTWVPEYYYEADGGKLYYASTKTNWAQEVCQIFYYLKESALEEDPDSMEITYFIYNMETKEVLTEEELQSSDL